MAALGAVLAGAPVAHAQQTVDEVTVIGRAGADRNARALSQAVSYADLDLTVPAQQEVLRRRISDTARSLCDRLDERGPVAFGRTCRDAAIRDSNAQVRTAIAEAPVRKQAALARAEADARAQQEQAMAAEQAATPAAATVPEATTTTRLITNGPVPDTPENRARHGGPNSRAGQATKPRGN